MSVALMSLYTFSAILRLHLKNSCTKDKQTIAAARKAPCQGQFTARCEEEKNTRGKREVANLNSFTSVSSLNQF